MFRLKNLPLTISLVVVVSLIVGWGISMVLAWTNPGAIPPTGNVAAPINVSGIAQTKSGDLNIDAGLSAGTLRFKGTGGDSGQPNNYYAIYQQSGAWVYPYPDLRIQYHTGIAMEAYYGYGGIRMYDSYDGTGNPYGLAFAVGNGDLTVRSYQDFYAPIMYDQNNAGYYLDPNVTSRLNYGVFDNVYSYGWMQGPIFYDSNDNGYYLNPNATTNLYTLCIRGVCRGDWPSGGITAESDTLDTVSDRGNTTNQSILSVGGGFYTDRSVNALGSVRAGTDVNAGTDVVAGGNVSARNNVTAGNNLYVAGLIYAPNQGWSDIKTTYPNTAYCGCDNGWYMTGANFRDGLCKQVNCASPFKKAAIPPPPGPEWPDSGCFTGDTKILMADGKYKEIKDVYTGDYVLTKKSPDSDELVKARVYKSMVYDGWDGYLIINNKLKVTTNHMIYVNGEWKEAGKIKIGDGLLGEGGKKEIVKSIEKINQPITVYNIEVDEYPTYFANGIYVHNRAKPM